MIFDFAKKGESKKMKTKKLKKKIRKYVASEVLTSVSSSGHLAHMVNMYGPKYAYSMEMTLLSEDVLSVYVVPPELEEYVYHIVQGYAPLIKAAIDKAR